MLGGRALVQEDPESCMIYNPYGQNSKVNIPVENEDLKTAAGNQRGGSSLILPLGITTCSLLQTEIRQCTLELIHTS